jgi:ABC-type lipoprotein export system ATPase subunit
MVSLINEFHKKKNIYLIDELTSALNDDNVQRVMKLILEQSKDSLILMATHDKRIMGLGEKIIIGDINK